MAQPTIIHRFADVAAARPERPAILGETHEVSYAALARAAGGHAAALTATGVQAGDRVALLTGHGAPTVAAILGTLAAGCAYVPLDPGFPVDRLRHMLAAADVRVLACPAAHRDRAETLRAGRSDVRVLVLDEVTSALLRPVPVDPDAPAYVLFTSGSTGMPKAVAQTHRNLRHVVDNQIRTLSIGPDDRLSLLASFSFDAAIPDLYPALLTGAAVVPVDLRRHGLAHAVEQLARHRVTVYHSTPTVYRFLLDTLGEGRLDSVRVVLLGGEQATGVDAARGRDRFGPGCVLVNGYGATEMTFAARHTLPLAAADPTATGPLPIGTALPGYELRLTDAGGIVVRSRHLAPGYLGQDSDRFAVDPDGVPTYATGDLGERLPDGALVCLGRLDRQVKVRGFRVELTEIEAVLAAQPGVAAVRAVARDGELLAYAFGAVAGGVLMSLWGGPRHRRMIGVLLGNLGTAIGCVLIGLDASVAMICMGAFWLAMAMTTAQSIYATIVQVKVPQRFHGRVFSLNQTISWSTLPIGFALLAPAATALFEPMLAPGGSLAGSVGAVIGTGPGRGIGFAYVCFGVALVLITLGGFAIRMLRRFDIEVPDSLPDDLIGAQERQRRLAARAAARKGEREPVAA